nr:hypothetical protein [Terracidiphilus gabretensis]
MNAIAIPYEERNLQRFFQTSHLRAEGRLRQVEAFRCASDISFFGDGDKIFEITKLDQV